MTRCQEHAQLACPVCNDTPMPLEWLIPYAGGLAVQLLERKFDVLPQDDLRFTRAWTNAIRVQTLKSMRQGIEMYGKDKYHEGYDDGSYGGGAE